MDDKEKLSLSIYDAVCSVKDTLSLPIHSTIVKTLYYSLALLACSIFSELTGFYTFISWQGCLACSVLLVILLWIERSENDALLKMYRAARVSTEKALRRAKAASTRYSSKRSTDWNSGSGEASGEQPDTRDQQQNQ
jgi:hypothetical protein